MRFARRFRRRRHVRRHARRRIRRPRRLYPRRRRSSGYQTFHFRFHRTATASFPASTPNNEGEAVKSLGWNMDHMYFTLEEFIKESKRPDPIPEFTSRHWPPFRYFRIRKAVVRGKWINIPVSQEENVLGFTALDLDGEDEGKGNATRSPVDPKLGEDKGGPYTYDPLMNRSSRRRYNARHGFTRVFRPKPQLLSTPITGGGMFPFFFRRQPWVSVALGSQVHWEGLSLSMRQWESADPIAIQYDIDLYVQFKEFDYEPGTQNVPPLLCK